MSVEPFVVVNAVTHCSQEASDYDRATELEALGGRLVELSTSEWQTLAQAATATCDRGTGLCVGYPAKSTLFSVSGDETVNYAAELRPDAV
jgi:hypothetical protein